MTNTESCAVLDRTEGLVVQPDVLSYSNARLTLESGDACFFSVCQNHGVMVAATIMVARNRTPARRANVITNERLSLRTPSLFLFIHLGKKPYRPCRALSKGCTVTITSELNTMETARKYIKQLYSEKAW